MKNKDDNLQFISKLFKQIGLQSSEKRAMRTQLEQHINEHQPAQWVDITRLYNASVGRAATAVAVAVFMLAGLTYAAEDALPGNPLYTVKTNVNEPFISFMAWSDSQQAETESRLAARRITELQQLLNSNSLTTSTSNELLARISDHTEAARKEIAELEMAANTKDTQAKELRSRLQALLAVEGEKIQQSLRETDTASTSSGSKIAQEAAQVLTDLARGDKSEPKAVDNATELSPGGQAVMNLLRITVRQMETSYANYREQNNPNNTPPPNKLVSAASALESAVAHVQEKEYKEAINDLEESLHNLDSYASSTARVEMQIGASNSEIATSGFAVVRGTTSETANRSNQGGSATPTGTDSLKPSPSMAPTRQALHNRAIKEAVATAKGVLKQYSFVPRDSKDNDTVDTSTTTQDAANSSATTSDQSRTASTSQQKKEPATTTTDNDESAM